MKNLVLALICFTMFGELLAGEESLEKKCPDDIVAFLGDGEQTKLIMRKMVKKCSDKIYEITGEVLDIDIEKMKDENGAFDDFYHLDLRVYYPPEPRDYYKSEEYEIFFAKDHKCNNLLEVKKGGTLTVKARIAEFGGYGNRWVTGKDATCKNL